MRVLRAVRAFVVRRNPSSGSLRGHLLPVPGRGAARDPSRQQRTIMASITGPEIERLIQLLARLPGLGPRSARRAALHLIKKREQLLGAARPTPCGSPPSAIVVCADLRQCRHRRPLRDLRATRAATTRSSSSSRTSPTSGRWSARSAIKARYHVLGGTLSALDGVGPEDLTIDTLVARVAERGGRRGHPGAQRHGRRPDHRPLRHRPPVATGVKVTRLAHGVPVGGELDYLDEGTLSAAFRQRTTL